MICQRNCQTHSLNEADVKRKSAGERLCWNEVSGIIYAVPQKSATHFPKMRSTLGVVLGSVEIHSLLLVLKILLECLFVLLVFLIFVILNVLILKMED